MILTPDQYNTATSLWNKERVMYEAITSYIQPNFIFELSAEQIQKIANFERKSKILCMDIGIWDNNLIMIPCPLDENGKKISLKDYEYSILGAVEKDIELNEIQTFTITQKSRLTRNLDNSTSNAEFSLPVTNRPILQQTSALEAIEMWKSEALDWFYKECKYNEGAKIFERFYISFENILHNSEQNIDKIYCVFGLKESKIYQMLLPTLIFISHNANLSSNIAELSSNTFDYARPCPPYC